VAHTALARGLARFGPPHDLAVGQDDQHHAWRTPYGLAGTSLATIRARSFLVEGRFEFGPGKEFDFHSAFHRPRFTSHPLAARRIRVGDWSFSGGHASPGMAAEKARKIRPFSCPVAARGDRSDT
jgi:hypothetical protein